MIFSVSYGTWPWHCTTRSRQLAQAAARFPPPAQQVGEGVVMKKISRTWGMFFWIQATSPIHVAGLRTR